MNLPWLQADQAALGDALDSRRLGHAPLLHGPAGLGKRALARWLIARILCLADDATAPCGKCRSCQLLAAGTHPDLFFGRVPEDKTQITVDVIRDVSAGLQLTPSIGQARVCLIDPAELMNTNAANALLKTLEEPADQSWLVLVSDRPDSLPATVRSRCQKITIRPPRRELAMTWLGEQSPQAAAEDIALALDVCADAPLKALELIEGGGLRFGIEVRNVLIDLAAGKAIAPATAESWAKKPLDSLDWIAHWLNVWLSAQTQARPSNPDEALPESCRPSDLARAWQRVMRTRQLAETSVRKELLLGKWLLEWEGIFAAGK